jgi:hypothetical protein
MRAAAAAVAAAAASLPVEARPHAARAAARGLYARLPRAGPGPRRARPAPPARNRGTQVRTEFYRDTQGALLAFDVGSRPSFEALPRWLAEAQRHGAPRDMVRGWGRDALTGGGARASVARPRDARAGRAPPAEADARPPAPSCSRRGRARQVALVVGTKADAAPHGKRVPEQEAREWAAARGLQYFEVGPGGRGPRRCWMGWGGRTRRL